MESLAVEIQLIVLTIQYSIIFFLGEAIITEAQRYHCKYNFTTASFIPLPRDLFYCRDFYFTAASFILLPRDLFYCREIYLYIIVLGLQQE